MWIDYDTQFFSRNESAKCGKNSTVVMSFTSSKGIARDRADIKICNIYFHSPSHRGDPKNQGQWTKREWLFNAVTRKRCNYVLTRMYIKSLTYITILEGRFYMLTSSFNPEFFTNLYKNVRYSCMKNLLMWLLCSVNLWLVRITIRCLS